MWLLVSLCFFFQAEDGIRDLVRSRGLGDVYKRQGYDKPLLFPDFLLQLFQFIGLIHLLKALASGGDTGGLVILKHTADGADPLDQISPFNILFNQILGQNPYSLANVLPKFYIVASLLGEVLGDSRRSDAQHPGDLFLRYSSFDQLLSNGCPDAGQHIPYNLLTWRLHLHENL